MTFTVQNIISSIALYIQTVFGTIPVYDSPTVDAEYPCFYVFVINPTISDDIIPYGKRFISLDVIYVQQRNVADANDDIYRIGETLDETFDMIPYTDGEDTIYLHTYERSWTVEDQELHYKLTLRQRVTLPRSGTRMKTMEEANVEVTENT